MCVFYRKQFLRKFVVSAAVISLFYTYTHVNLMVVLDNSAYHDWFVMKMWPEIAYESHAVRGALGSL